MKLDFITVVTGLPRSGTSLMMQMLAAGGIPPLTDYQRKPDESNPRGYFEFEPVKRLRADRSWLDQAHGRAIKVIHLLLRELPTDGIYNYRVILMKRSIKEVLASQRVMLDRQGKTGADDVMLEKILSESTRTGRGMAEATTSLLGSTARVSARREAFTRSSQGDQRVSSGKPRC